MNAFYVMIIASLLIAFGFLGAFIWSVKKGHYDDDYTPALRILLDDTEPVTPKPNQKKVIPEK